MLWCSCCLRPSRSHYGHDISESLESRCQYNLRRQSRDCTHAHGGRLQAFDSVLPVVSLGQVVHAFQRRYGFLECRGRDKHGREEGGEAKAEKQWARRQLENRIRSKWRSPRAVYKAKDKRHVSAFASVRSWSPVRQFSRSHAHPTWNFVEVELLPAPTTRT